MTLIIKILDYIFKIITVVALVFIVLKVAGIIDWTWLWVLPPIWIKGLAAILVKLSLSTSEAVITFQQRRAKQSNVTPTFEGDNL